MTGIDPATLAAANEQSRRLRALVRSPEILVMPGAYDALSARIFEHLGFKAIQGSSGAIAIALGYPDGERLSRTQTVEASRCIAASVSVPVNADGERGYGDAQTIGETVRAFVAAGCAGMNIEDGAPHGPNQPRALVPVPVQLEKLDAVMKAKRQLGSDFFVNARVDALVVLRDEPEAALREAVARGQKYAEAGADCVFYMNAHASDVIRTLVREVPAPVSVLAGPQTPPSAELQELGVARVSYGLAFGLAASGAVRRLANDLLETGRLRPAGDALSHAEAMALMER